MHRSYLAFLPPNCPQNQLQVLVSWPFYKSVIYALLACQNKLKWLLIFAVPVSVILQKQKLTQGASLNVSPLLSIYSGEPRVMAHVLLNFHTTRHRTFLFAFKIERHALETKQNAWESKIQCKHWMILCWEGTSLCKELKVLMYLGKQILWGLWVELDAHCVA